MKYRIVKRSEDSYHVQSRANWWPFWTTDSHYRFYDEPIKVEVHGGFFGDIVTEKTVHGTHSKGFWSEADAADRIAELKRRARERKIPKVKPKVVHTE